MEYLSIMISVAVIAMFSTALKLKKNKKPEKQYSNFKSPMYYVGNYEWRIDKVLGFFIVAMYFLFFILLIFSIIDMHYVIYCEKLLDEINGIEGALLAFIGVTISVIIFSVTLNSKEYYLTVTTEEINRHYHIDKVFQVLGICAGVSLICTILLQRYDLTLLSDCWGLTTYQLCCFLVVVCGTYALIIEGMLSLGGRRMELYSLNKLYLIFSDCSKLKVVNKTDNVIYDNISYLIKKYVKLKFLNNNQLSELEYIEYTENLIDKKWYNLSSKVLIKWLSLSAIISFAFQFFQHKYIIFAVNVALFIICIMILKIPKLENVFGKYVRDFVLSEKGYIIKFQHSELFIGTVFPIYYNHTTRKYILNISNMMAFYCLVCSCWTKKENTIIKSSLIDMINFIKEYDESNKKNNEKNYERALLFLPVFLCGYFYFTNYKKKKFPKEIIDLFKSFELTDVEKDKYYLCMNSFIWWSCLKRPSKKDLKFYRKGQWPSNYYNEYIKNNEYWELFN